MGIAYCAEHDLGSWGHYLAGRSGASPPRSGRLGRRGRRRHRHPAASPGWTTPIACPALLVLGQVRARRGDPGVQAALDEARDLALATGFPRTGALDSFVSITVARAEWRWLQGDLRGVRGRGRSRLPTGATARLSLVHRRSGDLALARRRAQAKRPMHTFPAYALQISGDWRGRRTPGSSSAAPRSRRSPSSTATKPPSVKRSSSSSA